MILAVASGKGGTGKTTVSVSLARVFNSPVMLLDCDVEEPNCHLFLKAAPTGSDIASVRVPEIEESRCDACGECARFCQYHAIAMLGPVPLVFPELCHGCGGCEKVCPHGAIFEKDRRTGTVDTMKSGNITLIQGRLDIGIAMAPPLIRAVKARLQRGTPAILDAPPGTSCPVTATIRGCDLVILVTEPTPFGLHDLKLAVDMVKELGIPFGTVINRAGIGDDRVHAFCRNSNIPVLLEIPDDRRIAVACSRGEPVTESLPEYGSLFTTLLRNIRELRKTDKSSGDKT